MSYPFIDWALSRNNNFLPTVYGMCEDNPKCLENYNSFFKYLKINQCENIPEKLAKINCMRNYKSLLSEFEIAELLIKQGKKIEILLDDYDNMCSPPDMRVVDSSFDVYIEVKRMIDDLVITEIRDYLNNILVRDKLPFKIDIILNEDSLKIAYSTEDWTEKLHKICIGLNEFSEKYDKIDKKYSSLKILTSIGEFIFKDYKLEKGYVGDYIWDSPITDERIDNEKIMQKIKKDIIEKSKKRSKWKAEHKNKIFIVALDFNNTIVDPILLETVLFGSKTGMGIIILNKINTAKKSGWENYLNKIYEEKCSPFDLNNDGLYLTSDDVKNVSGVIGLYPPNRQLVFYPNPFAFNEINNPELVNYLKND